MRRVEATMKMRRVMKKWVSNLPEKRSWGMHGGGLRRIYGIHPGHWMMLQMGGILQGSMIGVGTSSRRMIQGTVGWTGGNQKRIHRNAIFFRLLLIDYISPGPQVTGIRLMQYLLPYDLSLSLFRAMILSTFRVLYCLLNSLRYPLRTPRRCIGPLPCPSSAHACLE